MKHDYQNLMESIHVPQGCSERVLAAAQNAPRRKRMSPLWPAAACAALVLAVVLGGVRLWEDNRTIYYVESLPVPERYFGITAHAAGLGANNGVLLDVQDAAELDGTVQTLSLTFADGREETGRYRLQTEELSRFVNEDGTEVFVPALAGETAETVTGIYAVPEDSRWLCWPVEGASTVSLSNRYGYRSAPGGQNGTFHAGIDIPAEKGTPVIAAAAGTVKTAEFDTDKGNFLVLDHGDGMETVYAHCLSLAVEAGDTVAAGQEIAAVGSTGKSTGPHLCFQVWQDGEAQNPVAYFKADIRDTLQMG